MNPFETVFKEWEESYGDDPCSQFPLRSEMRQFAMQIDYTCFYAKDWSKQFKKQNRVPEILDHLIEYLDQLKCEAVRLREEEESNGSN